ncbi:hypothetical protein GCM10010168_45950 [Actinoplanes ianthinogenes]|uniref:Integral membrane protein n=1 Tax=Actinoplanes ianthinogenes TaxID=122358 RepID=A0ABM7LPA0_9ACTN|nr:hypothetical protein [Actinoplanes ianthinogenes]BCJ41107.1 hypothetical protein Aiant_17640 [Actinoplanes ianthinogenes]GGR22868.1 hypothetical protein GCM10010168_45950 [Actinoplanes ianthinogenes]
MITVDGPTERRTARIQYVLVALAAAGLLWFTVEDKRLYLMLVPATLLIVGYRSWNVERLSPTLAQYYGHAVVAGAADRIVRQFAVNDHLCEHWTSAGAPTSRLLAAHPGQLAAGMAALRAAGPPPRPMKPAVRATNRTVAAALGVTLGLLIGSAPGWTPVLLIALVVLVVFRVVVAGYNRSRLAVITGAMRTNTKAELTALLDPPWTDRRIAVVQELRRMFDPLPQGRRLPELRMIELLLGGGALAGALAGSAF